VATKYFLAEQILYRLSQGTPNISDSVKIYDVMAAINQKINSLLKISHFSTQMAEGERMPDNLVIATYNNIPVRTFGGKKAKAVLPVMPVSLPRNIGVYEVAGDEFFTCPYIPVQAGQANMIKSQKLLSGLISKTVYEVYGQDIIFFSDITINNTTEVFIRLLVTDINLYDDYTPLPIPADFEAQIIEDLVKQFAPSEKQTTGVIDNYKTK
jgi:hypothetical protein